MNRFSRLPKHSSFLWNRTSRAIKAAMPLTQDAAVITAYRLQTQVFADKLRVTLQAIDRYEAQIAETAPSLPD